MDVLVTEINKIQYLVSLADVDMIFLKEEVRIFKVPNSNNFIIRNSQAIPLIEPNKYFPNLGNRSFGKEAIIIFSNQNNLYGLLVDDIIHQTQIVFNPLPQNLAGKANFISGSTSMASGQVSHLLDLISLVNHHLGLK
jgi:chemotaxis protein histidine kinase CheA